MDTNMKESKIIYVDSKPHIKCNVVMVETKDTTPLFLNTNQTKIGDMVLQHGVFYHLFITSDDEIKEGDWVMNEAKNEPHICLNVCECKNCKKIIATTDNVLGHGDNVGAWYLLPQISKQFIEKYIEEYNKNNKVEYICKNCNEKYPYQPVFCGDCGCKFSTETFTVNKGNQITEVLVEVEEIKERQCQSCKNITSLNIPWKCNCGCISFDILKISYNLKLDSQNQITIRKQKDSWSREEVIKLLDKFACDVAGNGMLITAQLKAHEWWIEENL